MRWIGAAIVTAALGILLLALSPASQSSVPSDALEAIVGSQIDKTANKLELVTSAGPAVFSVSGPASLTLGNLASGDTVWFVTDKTQTDTINRLSVKSVAISYNQSIGAILLAFSVVWTVILFLTQAHPWAFALGLDYRLSNSQTQIYLWFLVFTSIYLAELALRTWYTGYFGGIGASAKVLSLAGISTLTFGAARASTTIKVSASDAAAAAKAAPAPGRSRWEHFQDLLKNDNGQLDLADFQMIALTATAAIIYLVASAAYLRSLSFSGHIDLPAVDDTLLGGTAASQAAYLFKKFASSAGN